MPYMVCQITTIQSWVCVSALQRLDFNIELAPAEPRASGHVKASGTVPLAGVSKSPCLWGRFGHYAGAVCSNEQAVAEFVVPLTRVLYP